VKKYWLIFLTVALLITSACKMTTPTSTQATKPNAAATGETAANAVPAEYAQLYTSLKTALDSFDKALASGGNRPTNPVIFGAELLSANGNRGEELLKPGVIDSVKLMLNRFQEMGIKGVTFPIGYPLYTANYPRQSEYAAFFKQVVQEIKRRGMTVDIEAAVIFANTDFSPVKMSFADLTFEQFKAEKAKMVQAIIDDLHPDYLNLGCEPGTMAALLKMKEFKSPARYTEYVNYILQHTDRGNTKIIAGLGTWDDISYARSVLSLTNIDCLAIHIYPVIGDCFTKAISIAEIAAQYNKPVVLDECWLYKTDNLAGGDPVATPEIFRRDAYSFFTPLDEQFLAEIVNFARHYNVVYISPFWPTFFFGNVEYSAADAGLSYTQMAAKANAAASANMRADKFTQLGQYYRKLINDNS